MPAGSTVQGFQSDKLASFQSIMSDITGQPAEWIDVNPTSTLIARRRRRTLLQDAAAPIQLLSQVHAPADQLGAVQFRVQEAVSSGELARALRGIGLSLVEGSGASWWEAPTWDWPA